MRRGLCAAAAAAVVALSIMPLLSAPASAQSGVTVNPGTLSMSPSPNAPITTPLVSVSGHFTASGGFQPTFDWVAVNVVWNKGGPGPSQTYVVCGNPPNAPQGSPCSPTDVPFNQKFVPPLANNGPYKVTATGQAHDQSFLGNSNPVTATTNAIAFQMAVPPPNVTGVTATVDKTRQTTVSWNRDTTTPDLQSYYVYRKGPGDKDFTAVLQTLQQSTGARISVVDSGTQYKGGDYLYEIESRRNGASGDGTSVVTSDRTAKESQSNKATVPDPPPGTPQPPPTQPPANGGPPPVVKGTPTGVTRSSGFSGGSSSGSSSGATTQTSEAVTPDPGFARGLPYAAGSPAPDNAEEGGDNSAVAVTPGRHKSNSRGIFIPVAAGAILFVGAFHLRILKKRLDEPVGTALS